MGMRWAKVGERGGRGVGAVVVAGWGLAVEHAGQDGVLEVGGVRVKVVAVLGRVEQLRRSSRGSSSRSCGIA